MISAPGVLPPKTWTESNLNANSEIVSGPERSHVASRTLPQARQIVTMIVTRGRRFILQFEADSPVN
jgi:hypothetical protein